MTVFYFGWFIEVESKSVAAIIFHPSSCMITFCEMNFSSLSIHPNGSSKTKNIKAASISKKHITVKVKVKILYLKVETMH
jgi:hypothetical protein